MNRGWMGHTQAWTRPLIEQNHRNRTHFDLWLTHCGGHNSNKVTLHSASRCLHICNLPRTISQDSPMVCQILLYVGSVLLYVGSVWLQQKTHPEVALFVGVFLSTTWTCPNLPRTTETMWGMQCFFPISTLNEENSPQTETHSAHRL